jgi:hypothetical protein
MRTNITVDDIVHASFCLDTPEAMDYAYEDYVRRCGPTDRTRFEEGVRIMASVDVNTLEDSA